MMEDMKNLLIQALETRGVLGQIRSKLRSSVFKIVDDQDQKFNMGCGLKWENPTLYKITDTRIGQLSAELIREFMEYLRMDYSLSVFIPECSISPEKIKKEEIFGKLGFKPGCTINSKIAESPVLYMIIYYFIYSAAINPDDILDFINNVGTSQDLENKSEDIVNENLRSYYNEAGTGADNLVADNEDEFIEQELDYSPNTNNNSNKNNEKENHYNNNNLQNANDDVNEENNDLVKEVKINNNENKALKYNKSNNNKENNKESNEVINNDVIKDNITNYEEHSQNIDKVNSSYDRLKNSNQYNNLSNSADSFNNLKNSNNSNNKSDNNNNEYQQFDNINDDKLNNDNIEESIEEIINIDIDDSYEKSKKLSGTNYGISQSGFDATVNDKDLDKYTYIESIDNQQVNK